MQREIVKNTIRLGNSSAVILPNTWKYKKVRIQLVEELIVQDLLEILLNRDLLKEVIGVYLVGSYARGEESEDSDVDILIVTDSVNKQIKEGSYEMILVSVGKFEERFGKSLYLSSMVRESKTLINDSFIRESREMKIDIPVKKYVREIKSVIRFNEDNLECVDNEEIIDNEVKGNVEGKNVFGEEYYFKDLCIDPKEEKFLFDDDGNPVEFMAWSEDDIDEFYIKESGNLLELYCTDNKLSYEIVTCQEKYGENSVCSKGKCVTKDASLKSCKKSPDEPGLIIFTTDIVGDVEHHLWNFCFCLVVFLHNTY